MGLPAGKLNKRVRIEQQSPVTDTAGDPLRGAQGELTMAWALLASRWAAIEPLSAREFIQSGMKQSQVSARITIRYLAGVTAGMRVVHGSAIYNIEGPLPDKDSGLEYITLVCSQGPSSGS